MEKRAPKPATVEDLLARQDRTIARRQVLATGKTARWWDWKVTHDWQPVGDGVAVAHLGTPDAAQLEWAALLHCGPDAALSGDAALAHFGVKRLTVVEHQVALPPNGWAKRMEAPLLVVAPHRVTGLQRWVAGRPLMRLVHVHAAALHAAAWAASDEEAERRLTMTVQQGKSTPKAMRVALEQMPTLVVGHSSRRCWTTSSSALRRAASWTSSGPAAVMSCRSRTRCRSPCAPGASGTSTRATRGSASGWSSTVAPPLGRVLGGGHAALPPPGRPGAGIG